MNSLRRYASMLTVMLATVVCLADTAHAQSERITWSVIGAGGVTGASSNDIVMSSTLGQPVIGVSTGTDGPLLYQGFWYPRATSSGVDLEPGDAVAGETGLRSYPNPFTGSTTIRYILPERGRMHLAIYDMRGELVRTLVDGPQESGVQEILWDGRNDRGQEVASGPYLCLADADLASGGRHFTRRQMLQRVK
jgi:FlgD Ig-like domain